MIKTLFHSPSEKQPFSLTVAVASFWLSTTVYSYAETGQGMRVAPWRRHGSNGLHIRCFHTVSPGAQLIRPLMEVRR